MKFNNPSILNKCLSLYRIRSWHTESNALAKSKYIISTSICEIIEREMLSTTETSCVVQDFPGRNPCCLSFIRCMQLLVKSPLPHKTLKNSVFFRDRIARCRQFGFV